MPVSDRRPRNSRPRRGRATRRPCTPCSNPSAPDIGASATPLPDLPPDPVPRPDQPVAPARAPRPTGRRQAQTALITRWWLDRLIVADHQAREKLIVLLARPLGHLDPQGDPPDADAATSTARCARSADFGAMAHAMVSDPALDLLARRPAQHRKAANENLARELMELFTARHRQLHRARRQGGRAGRSPGGRSTYDERPGPVSRQPRTTPATRRSSARAARVRRRRVRRPPARARGLPAVHRRPALVPVRVADEPVPPSTPRAVVGAHVRRLTAMLRALLTDPAFAGTRRQLVKQPVEWAVGAMRQLGCARATAGRRGSSSPLRSLAGLGQVPFAPPSVGGWPAGAAWLTRPAPPRLRARRWPPRLAQPGPGSTPCCTPEALAAPAVRRRLDRPHPRRPDKAITDARAHARRSGWPAPNTW